MDKSNDNKDNKSDLKPLEKQFEMVVSTNEEQSASSNDPMEKSMLCRNPMLLSPVIECIIGFLKVNDVKNCRLVSREWGKIGKVALKNRAFICLEKPERHPIGFHSCFQDSATLFSFFQIVGNALSRWKIPELTAFFAVQEEKIKELELIGVDFFGESGYLDFDISCWISKSPMIRKDTKHLTKLSIICVASTLIIPLHILAHIKYLSLTKCRINVEAGIQICPIKLKLISISFYQDGIKLQNIQINHVVNFCKAKEVIIENNKYWFRGATEVTVNFSGDVSLEMLHLQGVQLLNLETSRWVVNELRMSLVPFTVKTQMSIKECIVSEANLDLFALPQSLEKLTLFNVYVNHENTEDEDMTMKIVCCSQPIYLENLKYLNVHTETDYSLLSHFLNCPNLIHLKLAAWFINKPEINSIGLPKSVKTLWVTGLMNYLVAHIDFHLEKLIFSFGKKSCIVAKKMCNSKTRVHDVVLLMEYKTVDSNEREHRELADFLEYHKRVSFCKRLYIGRLEWLEQDTCKSKLRNSKSGSILSEHVDIDKSSSYVFENGRKGRALSDEIFNEIMP